MMRWISALLLLTACGTKSNEEYQAELVTSMHSSLSGNISELRVAAEKIQTAAPVPSGRGWDAQLDAQAIGQLKLSWLEARGAYEKIEGAIAPLFPDVDAAIDARYEDFLAEITGGDTD